MNLEFSLGCSRCLKARYQTDGTFTVARPEESYNPVAHKKQLEPDVVMKQLGFFLTLIFIPHLFTSACIGEQTNTLPNGNKYIGEWKDGQPSGHGTMISPRGAVYVGEFRYGEPNGNGVSTLPNGTKYECGFTVGVPTGFGTITAADGQKYVGQIQRGVPNGPGMIAAPDGRKYVGEFKDGLYNGQGTLTASNGTSQRGEWRASKEYKVSGTWVSPDGTTELGTWNGDGSPSGGSITWKDGREYAGDWKLTYGAVELPEWRRGDDLAGRSHVHGTIS